ncbi:MAG TPA: Hsp33 family molecular chaperone HslO, partial [Pseudoxanthomonas sp.]|nr:Hsp33 family molecular chaperone HslO [Pseudoxanthomonas sp.]
ALFDTLQPDELLDTPAELLLHRLFHEEEVSVLVRRPLYFACSCSRERVAAMLHSLGTTEAHAALVDGQVEVHCEFCGQRHLFSLVEIEELFALPLVGMPAPERLQ